MGTLQGTPSVLVLIVMFFSLRWMFLSFPGSEVLQVYHRPIDWFSFAFYIWNLAMMGVVVIHWKGPLRLQQAYLIFTSALAVSRARVCMPYVRYVGSCMQCAGENLSVISTLLSKHMIEMCGINFPSEISPIC